MRRKPASRGGEDGGGRARAHRVIKFFFPKLNKVTRFRWGRGGGEAASQWKRERVVARSEMNEKSEGESELENL